MTRRHPKHRKFIGLLMCAACGAPAPSECAHVRMSTFDGATVPPEERGGTGLKPHDRHCVPLCSRHHRIQHNMGERAFWGDVDINPILLAQALWNVSGKTDAARGVLYRARMGVTL